MRPVVCALLLLGGLLAPPNAHAGSYGPITYTGGTNSVSGGTPHSDGPISPSGPVSWGAILTIRYGGATVNNVHSIYNGSASCSGTITATSSWVPASGMTVATDPPPDVIVVETGGASWSGSSYPDGSAASGTASNPFAPSGNRYSARSKAATVTASASLSSSVTGTGAATSTSTYPGQAVAVYQVVSISPVTISLGGTTPDANGNPNILVGQGCTASLSGIPSIPGAKITYQWSVSGTTFQNWSPTTPALPNATPPTAVNSKASYLVGGPGLLTNSTAHWYWDDGAALRTVSCTATITPPAGQGPPFPITATKNVSLQIPKYQAAGIGGYMQVNKLLPTDTAHSNLWAGPSDFGRANGLPAGMVWQATVTTPTAPKFGLGSLELVQLVKPSNSYTTVANPGTTVNDPKNGTLRLDGTYPYGNVVPESLTASLNDSDSPGLQLDGSVLLASANKGGAYTDYLMYLPPTPASTDGNYPACQWVALAQFIWSANGSASIPTTKNWADYAAQHGGSDAVGTVDPSTATLFSDVVGPLVFPSWSDINSGGSF